MTSNTVLTRTQGSDHTGTKCNKNLCSNNAVPPASAVRSCLGPSLAQVFFDYSHRDTLKLLDVVLTPPKTSKECFPVQSVEQLRESTLTIPTDIQIVKAFVHQNILEIGDGILENVKKQIEESLQEKVKRRSREKFYIYQAKKRWETKQHTKQLEEKFEKYIGTVRDDLQKQLEVEWTKAAVECAKNTQKAVVKERITVVHEMMENMRAEITYVVQSLYKEFEDSFYAQRNNIIADFNQIMREKHVKMKKEMHEFEEKVNADLHVQKRQFEMQNVADVMYVLCIERIRSNREKHIMHKFFQQQIDGFHELIVRLHDVMMIMRKEIVYCHAENKILEEELCEVVKQFQKFIDFVFRAVPDHANYLLPLELQKLIASKRNEDKTAEEKRS